MGWGEGGRGAINGDAFGGGSAATSAACVSVDGGGVDGGGFHPPQQLLTRPSPTHV